MFTSGTSHRAIVQVLANERDERRDEHGAQDSTRCIRSNLFAAKTGNGKRQRTGPENDQSIDEDIEETHGIHGCCCADEGKVIGSKQ